jgi:hypothetical protein
LDRGTFNIFLTEALELLDRAKQLVYKLYSKVVRRRGWGLLAERASDA